MCSENARENDHVFISYSSRDAELTHKVCSGLEEHGLNCWIAPRDVESGAYAASIIRAIRSAKALLFIASESSAASGHVSRELERAVDAGIPILPLRIDECTFSEELEYYLAGMHWTDLGTQHVEDLLPELGARLLGLSRNDPKAQNSQPVQRKASIPERVLQSILTPAPTLVGLGLAAIGLVFVLLSAFIGVAEYSYLLAHDGQTIRKEVGFLWAINWSLALVFVYPSIAGIGLQALRQMARASDRLEKRRMVVDASFRAAQPRLVETEIQAALRRSVATTLVIGPLLILYAGWEFHTVVGQHYLSGDPFPDLIPLGHAVQERDWSVAALLPAANPPAPAHWSNYAFALAAYLWLVGFGTTLVLSIFIAFVLFAAAIFRLSGSGSTIRIVPDLRTPAGRREFDPRCGFELFEPVFRLSMIVVLLSFVALFLVTLQNTYIRSPDSHILDYVLPNLSFPNGILTEFVGGKSERSPVANLNGALAAAAGGLLFAMIVFGLAITLRNGARQAHDLMLERAEDAEEPLPVWLEETDRNEVLKKLDAMRFWPVRWLGLNRILAAIAVAALSLVFHKLGILVAAIALVYVLCISFDTRR